MRYNPGNPQTIRDLEPLYRIAHKVLLSLLQQERHQDGVQFIAKFSIGRKEEIRITYYKKSKSGKTNRLFSKDYPFKYKSVMYPNKIRPQVSHTEIKVNGKTVDLSSQVIYLDR